tara:strand:- start:1217 stop:1417 length:201 start_codon:yes stop_codon:yes gene_type:complete
MYITRKSIFTGETHALELNITRKQLDSWEGGTLIQDAFPKLTVAERDFIKFGVTEEEWNDCFKDLK